MNAPWNVAGVVCCVASAVGLWAVFLRSNRAAKVYMLTWPTKYLVGVWTSLAYSTVRKKYGVEQGAGSIVVAWLINIFVLLYFFKVWYPCIYTRCPAGCLFSSFSAVPFGATVNGTTYILYTFSESHELEPSESLNKLKPSLLATERCVCNLSASNNRYVQVLVNERQGE